jgi:hypothetical protein
VNEIDVVKSDQRCARAMTESDATTMVEMSDRSERIPLFESVTAVPRLRCDVNTVHSMARELIATRRTTGTAKQVKDDTHL